MSSIINIDGSVLEGGGQILRIAACLGVVLMRSVRVTNIRAARGNPGLRPQHVKGLEVLQKLSKGLLEGAIVPSTEIVLVPRRIEGGEFKADTETAGSITLLLQSTLLGALFADRTTVFQYRGGTNTDMAPQLEHLTEIFRPVLEKFGATFDYKIVKRGYYPRGGGEIHFRVKPVSCLHAVTMLEAGEVNKIWGWAFVAGPLPLKMAQVMATVATDILRKAFPGVHVLIEAYKETPDTATGAGSGINIVAFTTKGMLLGGSALGKRGDQSETVASKAANELIQEIVSGGCVDRYCQDQIITLMALAKGKSAVKIGEVTDHTRTAIHVCEKMTKARFDIIKTAPNSNIIECTGIGLENSYLG